jgi:uncharacterized protein (DUF302 family)
LLIVTVTEVNTMLDDGRRVVIDLPFDEAVAETTRAIEAEGLEVIGRLDVRDHFHIELLHDFRRYLLLDAWAPLAAFEALRRDLDAGATLPLRVAIYELADGETAVTVDGRGDPAARVLGRLRRLPRAAFVPAA